ncbi:hypothetical protein [Pseudomonas sp. Irchel s3f7]|uniref:hypothetical protein n=1 Tax=Pseudomonas sp. Irchel s3f7 TaxID=2009153 RepID=UPI000BA399B2|nr:hypothetical protein [Pseudomonas sp. Irchel s3f7]
MTAVTDHDVEFAQAVVALARKHGMTGISMEFRQNFDLSQSTGCYCGKRITWSEGRHGDEATIKFRTEAEASFPEKAKVTP